MCRLASEKDGGFARDVLHDMLGSFDRFSADELGIHEAARRELSRSIQQWRHETGRDVAAAKTST